MKQIYLNEYQNDVFLKEYQNDILKKLAVLKMLQDINCNLLFYDLSNEEIIYLSNFEEFGVPYEGIANIVLIKIKLKMIEITEKYC